MQAATANDTFYGMGADTYDLFHTENNQGEIPFYSSLLRKIKGPILEPGCGSGRFLIPIARAGFKIEGFDCSNEMLSRCENRLRAENLESHLVQGLFHSVNMGKKY